MTINERIRLVVDTFFNGNVSAFCRAIKVKQPTMNTILGERQSKPSFEVLASIINADALSISADWLLTGSGEMLKAESTKEAQPLNAPIVLQVPLVSQYAQAGYLSGYVDDNYMSTLPTIPYIVDHEAQGHYIAFEVKGDSMNDGTEDAIMEGDRLLCREVAPHLWAESQLHIRKWDFVIVHEEGILVKRIIAHDVENHTITIHSLNPMFPDKTIDLAEVKQIFNVIELQRPKRR